MPLHPDYIKAQEKKTLIEMYQEESADLYKALLKIHQQQQTIVDQATEIKKLKSKLRQKKTTAL